MKKAIDIEELVQWAIRDELPKGRPVSADIGFAIGRGLIRPGSIARSLSRTLTTQTGSMGYVPGEPCADARRVAEVIGTLDTAVRLSDSFEAMQLFGESANIAGNAVSAILASTFNPQAIIVCNAAQGKRPNWSFGAPKPHQRFVSTSGRPRPLVYGIDPAGDVIELKRNEGRARKRDGEYAIALAPRSPLEWCDPSPLAIAAARAEYLIWHRSISILARRLTGKLDGFEPMRPKAAQMPWLTNVSVDFSAPAVATYCDMRANKLVETAMA